VHQSLPDAEILPDNLTRAVSRGALIAEVRTDITATAAGWADGMRTRQHAAAYRDWATASGAAYQTWWATSATSSSLSSWVSSLMRLAPMETGENPHCVDSASRSRST
jgi:hypothetical protein